MGVMYTGYDCTKLPENQLYPGEDYKLPDGSAPTWKQYFEYAALRSVQELHVLEDLAAKDGFVVDQAVLDQSLASIDSIKTQLSESAKQAGTPQSFGSWLRETYGKGMNEKTLRDIITRQTIAGEYAAVLSEKGSENSLKDNAALEAAYAKDPSLYNCVDFRIFSITPETDENATSATQEPKDAAKKKADEMFGKITDEASFKKLAAEYATKEQKEAADYSLDETTLMKYVGREDNKSSFGEDAVKWLFDKNTKVNDTGKIKVGWWTIKNYDYNKHPNPGLIDLVYLFRNHKKVKATYSQGFIWIALLILVGQILIVQFAGPLFNVEPLTASDWLWLLIPTSVVLIIPEIFRCFRVIKR
jgi:hypothetical protein